MNPLDELIKMFGDFPGIGPRQARRFAYYILGRPDGEISTLSRLMSEVKKNVKSCNDCARFFPSSENSVVCDICRDKTRDQTMLVVVSRDVDLEATEKSGAHHGLYYVLGGSVLILEKNPEKRVRIKGLITRIDAMKDLKEIVLSLSATPDGDHTAEYIKSAIKDKVNDRKILVTVLGRGLSTGSELEYADTDTIQSAMKNRH
jgi:recombination protein RecR